MSDTEKLYNYKGTLEQAAGSGHEDIVRLMLDRDDACYNRAIAEASAHNNEVI